MTKLTASIILSILISIQSTSNTQFHFYISEPLHTSLKLGVYDMLEIGQNLPEYYRSSGAYQVFKEFADDLQQCSSNELFYTEKYALVARITKQLYQNLVKSSTYQQALMQAEGKKDGSVWNNYMRTSAQCIYSYLNSVSHIKFPDHYGVESKTKKLFILYNIALSPKLDGPYLKASIYILYYLQQLCDEEMAKNN